MSEDAKREILASIAAALASSRELEGDPPPLDPSTSRGAVPTIAATERLSRFRGMLERVGAGCTVVANLEDAATAVRDTLREAGAEKVAVSNADVVSELAQRLEGVALVDDLGDRAALLDCPAGLTTAQFGIAETGTLVLVSSAETHRLVSLLPPLHVAVLRESRILGTLDDALKVVGPDGDATEISRAITFVTGPSRTADIELTLVVGVHGPKHLQVIVVREEDSA